MYLLRDFSKLTLLREVPKSRGRSHIVRQLLSETVVHVEYAYVTMAAVRQMLMRDVE